MKKHLSKRLIALLLTLAMVLSLVPMVFAEETQTDEYVLATELHDGDEVVLFYPTEGKVMTGTEYTYSGKTTKIELTAANADRTDNGTMTPPTEALVLTVGVDENGKYSFCSPDGRYLYLDGTDVKLVSEAGDYTLFELEQSAVNEDGFYLKSANAEYNGKPQYLEYYKGYFTCYGFQESKADIYTFEFYAKQKNDEDPEAKELSGKTIILHTNDTHGALMGFAQVAKVKADYEAKGATVILVDAGDYSQGTTYVSTNKGEAAVTMLNAAGYDYVTLGNHEFDFGYAQLMANMEKAEFQPIVADVLLKETG